MSDIGDYYDRKYNEALRLRELLAKAKAKEPKDPEEIRDLEDKLEIALDTGD